MNDCHELVERAGAALDRLRRRRPLVMCLTNTVVAGWSANGLLALGAVPAMVEEPDEARELAASADAVLVNVGTLTSRQAAAIRAAVAAANAARRPWVLDPVAVDRLTFRRDFVRELLPLRPVLVRGNAREIAFLRERGALTGLAALATDAIDTVFPAEPAAEPAAFANGTPLLASVTGTGCAQGAIAAAFAAVEADPVVTAAAAALTLALAGEDAARRASAPGSFQIALLDALATLTADDLVRKARCA